MSSLVLRAFFTAILLSSILYASESDAVSKTAPGPSGSLQLQQESLQKQRESLRLQTEGASAAGSGAAQQEFIGALLPPLDLDCSPLPRNAVDALISPAASKNGVASSLLYAVMKQESGFRPCALSEKGALGLMQLMPATAEQFRVADPFDPEQNIQAGAALLKELLTRYKGDLRLTLAAYNAGANRADQANSAAGLNPVANDSYPLETQRYIAAILAEIGREHIGESADPQDDGPAEILPGNESTVSPQ